MKLIDKEEVVTEIKKRIKETESMLSTIDPFWEGQISAFDSVLKILDTIETKEVDLEKEVHSQMDLLCNLLCYMDELSNGDSEGIYPLPEKVVEDLQRFAEHFFKLGFKHRKKNKI